MRRRAESGHRGDCPLGGRLLRAVELRTSAADCRAGTLSRVARRRRGDGGGTGGGGWKTRVRRGVAAQWQCVCAQCVVACSLPDGVCVSRPDWGGRYVHMSSRAATVESDSHRRARCRCGGLQLHLQLQADIFAKYLKVVVWSCVMLRTC